MAQGLVANDELFENLRLELRRGSLVLAVLSQLRTEHYGYILRKALADQGMEIDENTLYPLLRRLETQGLLVSEWREEEKRNKRFYRLSEDGKVTLGRLVREWSDTNTALVKIITAAPKASAESQNNGAEPATVSETRSKDNGAN